MFDISWLKTENRVETCEYAGTVFKENVDFKGKIFHRFADFSETTFHGKVDFCEAVFFDGASFKGAKFICNGKDILFENAVFLPSENNDVDFSEAQFGLPYKHDYDKWRIGFQVKDKQVNLLRTQKGLIGPVKRELLENIPQEGGLTQFLKTWDMEDHADDISKSLKIFLNNPVSENNDVDFSEAQFGLPYEHDYGKWRIEFQIEDKQINLLRTQKGLSGPIKRELLENIPQEGSLTQFLKTWDMEDYADDISKSFKIFLNNPVSVSFKECRFGDIKLPELTEKEIQGIIVKKNKNVDALFDLEEKKYSAKKHLRVFETHYAGSSLSEKDTDLIGKTSVSLIISCYLEMGQMTPLRNGKSGNINFRQTQFYNQESIDYSNALFINPEKVDFSFAIFGNGKDVSYESAIFGNGGGVNFRFINFHNGKKISFKSSTFNNGEWVNFTSTNFSNRGGVGFSFATFKNRREVNFAATFFNNEKWVDFSASTFNNGQWVTFNVTSFTNEGNTSFSGATFNNGDWVIFSSAVFSSGGNINFSAAHFSNKELLDFRSATFNNEKNVNFESANFKPEKGLVFKNVAWVNNGNLSFKNAKFMETLSIKFDECLLLSAKNINFTATRFPEEGSLMFQRCYFSTEGIVDFTSTFFRHTIFEGGLISWLNGKEEKERTPQAILGNRLKEKYKLLPQAVQDRLKKMPPIPVFSKVFNSSIEVWWKDLTTESAKHLTFRNTAFNKSLFDGMTLSHIQLNAPHWRESWGRKILYGEEELLKDGERSSKFWFWKECKLLRRDKNTLVVRLQDIENQYTQLKNNLERQGAYQQAGYFHRGEQETRQKILSIGDEGNIFFRFYISFLGLFYKWNSQYGEKPLHTLISTLFLAFSLTLYNCATKGFMGTELTPSGISSFIFFNTLLQSISPFSWKVIAENNYITQFNWGQYAVFFVGQVLLLAIQLPLLVMTVRRYFKR